MGTVTKDLDTVVDGYIELTELLLTKKDSIPSYDFSQFIQMKKLADSHKYDDLATFGYFDDLYERNSMNSGKIRIGIAAMAKIANAKHEVAAIDNIELPANLVDSAQDPYEPSDLFSNTGNAEGGNAECGCEEPSDLFDTVDAEGAGNKPDKHNKQGRGDPTTFKHRDRIMYFETLPKGEPVKMQHVKEILGIENEEELDKIINMDDKHFAEWVSKQYDVHVGERTFMQPTPNMTLAEKISYLLKREATFLGY